MSETLKLNGIGKDAMDSPPYFIRRKSVPVWIGIITAFILMTFLYGRYYQIEEEQQAISFLNTNTGLLVTILAVTMSFTLIGLQFLAESYTPRALPAYLKDKIVYGFPILYIALISLNLISAAVPSILPPIKFLQFAVLGTIFSLAYLVAFVYYVINKIQPEWLIRQTSNTIKPDVWKNIVENHGTLDISSKLYKPFIILQQSMVKAVYNNDIFSFADGLAVLFDLFNYFLDRTRQPPPSTSRKYRWDSYFVYTFFFRIFSPLVSESLSHGREQFIIQYQWHMYNLISKIYVQRDNKAISDFWEQIDYLGHKIFNLEMVSAADAYLRQLKTLLKLELETVKKTKQDLPKDPMGHRHPSDDELINEILTDDFEYSRIGSLTKFGIIAADKRMASQVSTILNTVREIIEFISKINDRVTRTSIMYSVMRCVKEIHERCADNGLHNTTWTTGWLDNYIQKIDRRYLDEAKTFTESICKLSGL